MRPDAVPEWGRRLRGTLAVLLYGARWMVGVATRRYVTVRVFHNTATDADGHALGFDGYRPEHPVVEVWQLPVPTAPPLDICERVYQLLNIGDDPDFGDPDLRAVGYRRRRNRSLSVGDCLAVGDRFYAVAPTGFTAIGPPQITDQGRPGSTPLWGPTPT
ncbi:hypothetical protein [Actinomadura rupiterrae]|uniref:hypothetical protein n=1 Tax=Actinomadura rupiterrae TaxID=559627 RepID=UPI0020A3A406|nr:hypothetical protein [Actinomadura rupiterrae]MCP2341144.1 hypothetical protein [Actinomadura rupiterrae]